MANCRAVPRTYDVWVGINKLRAMLPRFSFRVPQCERGLEALSNYRTIRETSTGIAKDEPCHDWSSHAADSLRLIAEAESAGMLSRAGISGGMTRRQPVKVHTGLEARMTPGMSRAFWIIRPSEAQREGHSMSDEERMRVLAEIERQRREHEESQRAKARRCSHTSCPNLSESKSALL
jgi:hypothetical protein